MSEISAPVLRAEALSKSFGGLTVVHDVSFDVEDHGRVALIGPNGAGKTTIFNLISGVYHVDAGRIFVQDVDVTDVPSRKRIDFGVSRSFQNIRLMQHLTVLENLYLGQHHVNAGFIDLLTPFRFRLRHRWQLEAMAALERAGLAEYTDATIQELPYGVRKRVDLVRATLARPRILMLDEPAAGLNPSEADDLKADLLRLSSDGVGLLIVEHDMAFVRELCDHVIVLNFGEKIAEGSMADIRENELVREAYLGGDLEQRNAA
ncbi:MAG: ABC transporter ATP-binding protein [Pseudomonadota bacterium]